MKTKETENTRLEFVKLNKESNNLKIDLTDILCNSISVVNLEATILFIEENNNVGYINMLRDIIFERIYQDYNIDINYVEETDEFKYLRIPKRISIYINDEIRTLEFRCINWSMRITYTKILGSLECSEASTLQECNEALTL